MSGWVKWEKDKEQEPGFKRLVRKVRNTCVTDALQPETAQALAVTLTMGALLKLWSFADTYIRADDTLDMGPDDIDELVAIPGFASALPEDWLRIIDDEHVELPGYQSHNGIEAKKAALSQKRMENKRTREKRNDSVTTNEHVRNRRVTGASPDQTRPDQTRPKPPSKSDTEANSGKEGKANGNGHHSSLTLEQVAALQVAYPKGVYLQSDWLTVEKLVNAHMDHGVTFEHILASFQRYATQQQAKGNIGSEFIRSPAVHCDISRPLFDEPFEVPVTKAERRTNANLDAAAQAARELFGEPQ